MIDGSIPCHMLCNILHALCASSRECLKLIPHQKFSFAKIWLMAAQFEIRQRNLKAARQILGNAIGMAPKDKIFKKYIEIELQLSNITHCRTLYEKYQEWAPANCYAWCKYAEFERTLNETERARALFELAIAQPALGMPELLWKVCIPARYRRWSSRPSNRCHLNLDQLAGEREPEETKLKREVSEAPGIPGRPLRRSSQKEKAKLVVELMIA